jgi:hypothetical protein
MRHCRLIAIFLDGPASAQGSLEWFLIAGQQMIRP